MIKMIVLIYILYYNISSGMAQITKELMRFRQVTESEYYEIVMLDKNVECHECNEITYMVWSLDYEENVFTCPKCMVKHITE